MHEGVGGGEWGKRVATAHNSRKLASFSHFSGKDEGRTGGILEPDCLSGLSKEKAQPWGGVEHPGGAGTSGNGGHLAVPGFSRGSVSREPVSLRGPSCSAGHPVFRLS